MQLQDDPKLYTIRHSLAHVLAQAVRDKYPTVKLGFGPPIDNGFYYDFDFGSESFGEADLKDLEKRMRKIINHEQKFERVDCDFSEAVQTLKDYDDEPYKQENLSNLKDRGVTNFSFYKNGKFMDVCEGPHVEHTGLLPADGFKLDRISGAYWLGSESNSSLTRIYALAFSSKPELQEYIRRRDLAKNYDHKKLGKELDLFHFDNLVGKGLPLWLPNGTVIRDCIQRFAEDKEFEYGYKRVASPNIAKGDLYKQSGHAQHYQDSMFPPMNIEGEDGELEQYFLKPMNCPHHHLMFGSRQRSYRDLPLRLAEYGTCYRYEQSGELSGLVRVRCMTMNDAHIYLREDQFEAEFKKTIQLYKDFYDVFKLRDYKFRLSIRSSDNAEKFEGDPAMWDKAEAMLEKVLKDLEIDFYVGEGEAAFYGPKIDIQFKNVNGREETVSTIQVDFLSSENFDLSYIGEDGKDHTPVIIHRAPLSTHERFISFLIEYYGGAFPTWCAPVQVAIIPVHEQVLDYCKELQRELHSHKVRIEIDNSDNSLNKKIRMNTKQKIPLVLVIGEKEKTFNSVNIRRYSEKDQTVKERSVFIQDLLKEIEDKTMNREPMGSLV